MFDVRVELRVDCDAPECTRGVAKDNGWILCREAELPTPTLLLLLLLLLLFVSPMPPMITRVASHR